MNDREKMEIDSSISALMEKSGIPSVILGIVSNEEVLYSRGYGWRDFKANLPINSKSIFGIGSVSKSFTSLAIMQLYEKELLNLDDPVSNYIDYKLGTTENPVKIKHLLSNTSGHPDFLLAAYELLKDTRNFQAKVPIASRNDYLMLLNQAKEWQVYPPGEHMFYHNDGFTCLAMIIEKCSGLKFEDYMEQNIFQPLGMTRSSYSKEMYLSDDNHVNGYFVEQKTGELSSIKMSNSEFMNGCGGILSTNEDMLKYMQMLLNNGTFDGNSVISPSSIQELWTPRIKSTNIGDLLRDDNTTQYCYGWFHEKIDNIDIIYHGGGQAGWTDNLLLVPEKNLGVFMGGAGILNVNVWLNMSKNVIQKLFNLQNPFPPRTQQKQIALHKIMGTYEIYKGFMEIEIKLSEYGFLIIEVKTDKSPFPRILPLSFIDPEKLLFEVSMGINKIQIQFKTKLDSNKKEILWFELARFVFFKKN